MTDSLQIFNCGKNCAFTLKYEAENSKHVIKAISTDNDCIWSKDVTDLLFEYDSDKILCVDLCKRIKTNYLDNRFITTELSVNKNSLYLRFSPYDNSFSQKNKYLTLELTKERVEEKQESHKTETVPITVEPVTLPNMHEQKTIKNTIKENNLFEDHADKFFLEYERNNDNLGLIRARRLNSDIKYEVRIYRSIDVLNAISGLIFGKLYSIYNVKFSDCDKLLSFDLHFNHSYWGPILNIDLKLCAVNNSYQIPDSI